MLSSTKVQFITVHFDLKIDSFDISLAFFPEILQSPLLTRHLKEIYHLFSGGSFGKDYKKIQIAKSFNLFPRRFLSFKSIMVHFALNLGLIQKVLRKSPVAYNNYI